MDRERSVLTIAAAIFLSWFLFRKSLKNPNTNGIPPQTTASASESASASVLETPSASASVLTTESASPSASESGLAATSASASSSSAAAPDSEGKYDVFLSFRGTDTRLGFTDYLYNDLVDAGIYTFRDSEKLQIGEEIGHDLLKAIEGSKIWIPIFSVNYAESRWCLREFAHIMKCQLANEGRKIYPVFYDVDVYDVTNQQGSYANSFREHEKNFDEKTVREWREALKTVGKFKGYELKTETHGHEGLLVKKLVKDVLLELKKNYADVRDDLVGMDDHLQKMIGLLEVDYDGVRIVGVHGMGGIGKTTIAKSIYNKLCDSFDGCCFLEDVQEKVKQHPNGLVDMQRQLVFQILKKDFPDIVNANDGIKKIRDIVHRKKILVVLDDVDEKSQFDKLVGECNWLNKGSRIIVTTRNKEVLDALEATCSRKGLHEAYRSYEPDLMTDSDSLKLFSNKAFMRDSPPEDYLSLSQKVTSIAARLPLVLVTLGSLFLGIRSKDRWIAKLKKLEKVPNKDVMGKLRVSFDALDDDDKSIFLDIACLFIGEDKAHPYYMWEDCGFVPEDGINTLVLRSLVKIGDDNKLGMHDQLRDLGRQIVQEENEYKLSRMWRPEEALNVLEGGLGVENVEALNLDLKPLQLYEYEKLIDVKQEYEEVGIEGRKYYVRHLKGQSFSRLQNLRFLRLSYVILDTDSKNIFSNLRWLEWRCYNKIVPTNMNLKNLVILNLSYSKITDEWEGWNQLEVAKMLKALDLSGCLGLIRGSNLSTFKDLESLNMKACYSIVKLPGVLNLRMLKKLVLDSCSSLHEIEGLASLVSLEHLNMNRCKSIERLPGLSNLRMLKELLLEDCINLHDIEGLGGLVSLERLNMNSCYSIKRLSGLSNLRMLRKLHLRYCKKLRDIEGLGGLVSLEYLDMNRCKSIEALPGLSNLRMLRKLDLRYCEKLHDIDGLGDLVFLEYLNMTMCRSIVRLPDLSNLRVLKILIATSCYELPEIRGLGSLIFLESLYVYSCCPVERLPNLSNLGKLKELTLVDFPKLHEIEGFSGLVSLEILNLSYCTSLNNSLDFSCLKNLKRLELKILEHWTDLRGLEELKSLQVLVVSDCRSLEKLPDLSNLTSLKKLDAEGCTKLREIKGLSGLVSLETLNLSYCSSLENTLDFSCLKNLKELRLNGFNHCTMVGLEKLKSIESFLLERLPELCTATKFRIQRKKLTSLKDINTYGCEELRERN